MVLPSSRKVEVIMSSLIVATVVRNLSVACSFVGGAWAARAVVAWVGRDVTVIMP